jgi:hypothetical protein
LSNTLLDKAASRALPSEPVRGRGGLRHSHRKSNGLVTLHRDQNAIAQHWSLGQSLESGWSHISDIVSKISADRKPWILLKNSVRDLRGMLHGVGDAG